MDVNVSQQQLLLRRILVQEAELQRRARIRAERDTFLGFIRHVAPWFIIEEVHILICAALERLAYSAIDRLMIFMPPRTGKSQLASIFFPAWYLGRFSDRKVMEASHSKELSLDFGRQVKYLVESPEYLELFPEMALRHDNRSAGRWGTVEGGVYTTTGVGGAIAGKGYHLGIADDLISEQDKDSKAAKEFVKKWWGPGFYTRRQPEVNSILLMGTRWAKDDPAGFLLEEAKKNPDADQWEVLKVEALLSKSSAEQLNRVAAASILRTDRHPQTYVFMPGDSFAPRRWPLNELLRSRNNMSSRDWSALYQQSPVEDEGHIFKRHYWREWKGPLPKCEYVLSVYDTALEEEEANDYSARTTWGIFYHEDVKMPERDHNNIVEMHRPHGLGRYHAILLERWEERVDFPALRKLAKTNYEKFKQDRILVEKKASGHSLIHELRRYGVPVSGVKKGRRESKLAMYNIAVLPFEQGCVWYPAGRKWAESVIDHCADLPYGEHDDIGDTVAIAMRFLRNTFHLQLPGEEEGEPEIKPKRRGYGGK